MGSVISFQPAEHLLFLCGSLSCDENMVIRAFVEHRETVNILLKDIKDRAGWQGFGFIWVKGFWSPSCKRETVHQRWLLLEVALKWRRGPVNEKHWPLTIIFPRWELCCSSLTFLCCRTWQRDNALRKCKCSILRLGLFVNNKNNLVCKQTRILQEEADESFNLRWWKSNYPFQSFRGTIWRLVGRVWNITVDK